MEQRDPIGIKEKKSERIYTHCYCEENIYKLCEFVRDEKSSELDSCYAIFLSSDEKLLPMWYQNDTGSLIVWDYHVILIHKKPENQKSTVYDLDTRLDFPSLFESYIVNSFLLTFMLRNPSKKLLDMMKCLKFRIVPACEYLNSFSSDRSHMIKEGGEYSATPPVYPPIRADSNTIMNLDEFRWMDRTGKGQILDLEGMCAFFGSNLDMLLENFGTYYKE